MLCMQIFFVSNDVQIICHFDYFFNARMQSFNFNECTHHKFFLLLSEDYLFGAFPPLFSLICYLKTRYV